MELKVQTSETELISELKRICEPVKNKTGKLKDWQIKNKTGKLKETFPQKSAKVFQQLGCLYKKQCFSKKKLEKPEKIKLIQSAALLNSALVRQSKKPETKKIQKDLQHLCSGILRFSKAKLKDIDLINFANNFKKGIESWRKNLKKQVESLLYIPETTSLSDLKQLESEKIDNVESLQNEIRKQYKQFMQDVSKKTIEILSDKPCDFALVGMGSMARKEITPYSDFENIILLQEGVQAEEDYEKILEYFRWYAVIFQVILINLGETILPSVAVPSLNEYTTEDGNWFF